jgi:hypothetical protein
MNALVQQLTRAGLSLQGAHSHALARIDAAVQAYAAALAYIDTYGMLGIAVVFVFFCLSFRREMTRTPGADPCRHTNTATQKCLSVRPAIVGDRRSSYLLDFRIYGRHHQDSHRLQQYWDHMPDGELKEI